MEQSIKAVNVDESREQIFYYIQRNRDKKKIYFHGWNGFGVAPVLRSVAQEFWSIKANKTPLELCFDRIIYIDCSAWESRRVMQRKIAEELELDLGTMAMFDKQNEKDDFNGVDHGSRDVIRSVSEAIAKTLVYKKLMMIFLNGSNDEVDLNRFGISPDYWDHVILWTFKRRPLTIHDNNPRREMIEKLRYTHLFLHNIWSVTLLTSVQFYVILREEAANIVARHPSMRGIDITMVTECCLNKLFLQSSFHKATGFDWEAHAPNYWVCDGIIKGDGTRDISDTLHQEIHWEIHDALLLQLFQNLMSGSEAPFFLMEEDTTLLFVKKPYTWISVISEDLAMLDENTLERVSSLFVVPGEPDYPQGLPDGFLKPCNNLRVLILCSCAFSFVSPPFLRCQGLRFLGLDHCTHDDTSEGENSTSWTWLQNLWVLDLRYTEWYDILSEEKIDSMTNLMELNIKGFMCWQLVTRLQGRVPYLRRLRIIRPTMRKAEAPFDSSNNLFMDMAELEILDLSGNRDVENLTISSSMARSLQTLIVDGCDGLENVVLPDGLPSSLRSFSFDGYGPATHWTSSFKLPTKRPEQKKISDGDTSAIKITKISLQGCMQLDNLFVRGLPNLEELDLSGTAIKVLDFGTMVTSVPVLKQLILLGCEHLRAIKWGPVASAPQLELLCVDTRPWSAHGSTRPCLAEHKSFDFQLHATLADARLARSLCALLDNYKYVRVDCDICFNIHVTSSSTSQEMIEPSSQQRHVEVVMYGDTFFKIGDAPMLFFPQPPTQQLDFHMEISDGSCGMEDELEHVDSGFAMMMSRYVESMHVHDFLTSASMSFVDDFRRLKWCRIERCLNLDTVFAGEPWGENNELQTIWASHLRMSRCIWSKGIRPFPSFQSLQHLHLRSCPRLQFVLPVWFYSFPSLETIHIIHCGDLTHVFPLDNDYPKKITVQGLPFPKLTTIHLHDLPKLQQICEVNKMLAPALETIRIRGCFGLRRLPAVAASRPAVEIEKDVWDSLEWDGLADGHHPDLFQPPVHSRYFRRSRLLRGSVLR